jgi:copper(I)-binding protein
MIGEWLAQLWRRSGTPAPDVSIEMMGRLGILGVVAIAAGAAFLAIHPEPVAQSAGVAVIHPWAAGEARARQSLPVYVVLRNEAAVDDRLLAIETPMARRALIKRLDGGDGLVRATELPAVIVPAQGRLAFRPGQLQITLVELEQPVAPGDSLPIVFRFARAGALTANVRIENTGTPEHADHF